MSPPYPFAITVKMGDLYSLIYLLRTEQKLSLLIRSEVLFKSQSCLESNEVGNLRIALASG